MKRSTHHQLEPIVASSGTSNSDKATPFGTPLWDITAPTAPSTHPLTEDITCNVAIVGGGVTGFRAALELAQNGVDVVVLEGEHIGFGGSGRSGGLVNVGYQLDPDDLVKYMGPEVGERMLASVSKVGDEVFNLVREHNLNCDAQQNGSMKASYTHAATARQIQQHDQWQRYGPELELLDGAGVERYAGAHGYKGGLLYRQGGTLQPLAYTRELARVAAKFGARLYEKALVSRISQSSGRLCLNTPKGSVFAEKVLICTNAYTDGLWPKLASTIVPIRSIQAATEPLPMRLRKEILAHGNGFSDTRKLVCYARLDRDYRLCFGSFGPTRDTFKPSDFHKLKESAEGVFPGLKGLHWDYHWGGRVGITKDSMPHLHQLAPGIYAGMGFNGRGIGPGTIMGRVLSEVALGKRHDLLDVPVTGRKPFFFHKLWGVGLLVATTWLALRDRFEI